MPRSIKTPLSESSAYNSSSTPPYPVVPPRHPPLLQRARRSLPLSSSGLCETCSFFLPRGAFCLDFPSKPLLPFARIYLLCPLRSDVVTFSVFPLTFEPTGIPPLDEHAPNSVPMDVLVPRTSFLFPPLPPAQPRSPVLARLCRRHLRSVRV